ncbi:MAG: hypothetical protein ACK52I_33635 [Pseudomonadota bacterium]|jgi:hypothetical protein
MSNRYRIDFGTNGVSHYTHTTVGDALAVEGEPMVRLAHGSIVRDVGFHTTLADASRDAAGRIEALGHRLLAQAERLRAEAASLEGGA